MQACNPYLKIDNHVWTMEKGVGLSQQVVIAYYDKMWGIIDAIIIKQNYQFGIK